MSFTITHQNSLFRRGKLEVNGKELVTPKFLPVLNFMTGNPEPFGKKGTGVFQNGGLWKYIKMEMIGVRCDTAVLTQILHFTDFSLNKKSFDCWSSKSVDEWVRWSRKEKYGNVSNPNYSPFVFVDSGGFKLLSETSYDLKEFGIEENPESIYKLQKNFGADAIMSLDYPFPPNLVKSEKKERLEKSINHAIRCLELWEEDDRETKPIPYLAVHGHGSDETNDYVTKLFSEINSRSLNHIQFGLAIGSLVRISTNFNLVADCILGVKSAIKSNKFNFQEIPIHVFGLSGYIAPFLIYLGVDTFDSNNYVQSATNLGFLVDNKEHRNKNFYDLNKKDCKGSKYADILHNNFKRAKEILREKPTKRYKFNGEEVPKSKIYSLIALHNLDIMQKEINLFLGASDSISYLVDYGLRTKKGSLLLRHLYDKEESQEIRKHVDSNSINLPKPIISSNKKKRIISMKYGPDDFNILRKRYKPDKKRVLLLLPCSSEKPYVISRTHKAVYREFKNSGINSNKIQKVSISGNYGPVPEEYENQKEIISYEFVLNSNSKNRMELVIDRTVKFLEKWGDQYEMIIGYATSNAYRTVIEKSFNRYGEGIIQPKLLSTRRGVEMSRKSNLTQLSKKILELDGMSLYTDLTKI